MENYNLSNSAMFDVFRVSIFSNTSNNKDLRRNRYDTLKYPTPSTFELFNFKCFFSQTTYDKPGIICIFCTLVLSRINSYKIF